MPVAAATATVSSFQQHFTWRKWKHRKRKWGWKGSDPQRAALCFPIVLAQLSLCWSRALLQLGPKAAAKEKPRQPSVQEEGCAGAGALVCAGEERWRAGGPQPHLQPQQGCLPWGNGTDLPILGRKHREEADRASVRGSFRRAGHQLSVGSGPHWPALAKDPESQGCGLTSQARAQLHVMASSSIPSPSKYTIGCACF